MIEQYNYQLFKKLINIQFNLCEKRGLLPKPPPDLRGEELKIEFISPIARNQKTMGRGTGLSGS